MRFARFLSASARPLPGAKLQSREADLFRQRGVRDGQFGPDAQQRLVESKPRFDADDKEIHRVGERQLDRVLTALRQPCEHHPGHDVSEQAAGQRDHDVGLDDQRRRKQCKEHNRHAEADPVEHRQRFVIAMSRLDQPLTHLADFRGHPRGTCAEPREEGLQLPSARRRLLAGRGANHILQALTEVCAAYGGESESHERDEPRREQEDQDRDEHHHLTPRS